jgi:hypothetical protein
MVWRRDLYKLVELNILEFLDPLNDLKKERLAEKQKLLEKDKITEQEAKELRLLNIRLLTRRYLFGIKCPIWHGYSHDFWQKVLGYCMDPIKGQRMILGEKVFCPKCKSRGVYEVTHQDWPILNKVKIPEASFTLWNALTLDQKLEKVRSFLRKYFEAGKTKANKWPFI